MQDVVVIDPGFCTPRIVIQRWLQTLQISRTKSRIRVADSRRFHYYSDTAGLNCFLYSDGNLLREAFLHLQSSAKRFRDTCELREAKDQLVWNIGNRDLATRRAIYEQGETRGGKDEMIGSSE